VTAAAILSFLNRNCRQIVFQTLPAYARQKNRALVEFAVPGSGEILAVGATSIEAAVLRANARIEARDQQERKAAS